MKLSIYLTLVLSVLFFGCDFESYEKICKPNAGSCPIEGGTQITKCSADGQSVKTQNCPTGSYCRSGACSSTSSGNVSIVTTSLPEGENALPYEAFLEAQGGVEPYAWQLLSGELPEGINLYSDGTISGETASAGSFPLTFRVIDGSTPPATATVDLNLEIAISPLEIIGELSYDAVVTKVIVLDVLIPYIEYNTDLQARGGLRPYMWTMEDPPGMLSQYISNWGLPAGFIMTEEGNISGTATSLDDATSVTLPNGTTLTGYFLYIQVEDKQNPSAIATSIFAIPTLPF